MFQNLICTKEGAVSIIQLNRPQKNSLNEELRQEMETVLKEIAGDPGQRVVIVTGGEEFFCAGADIGEIQEAKALAVRLAALPRLAMGASKMLINKGLEMDLAFGLELEARCFGNLATSHDLHEGTLAFFPKKRKPNFTGN